MVNHRAPALVVDLDDIADPVRNRVILFRTVTALAGQLRARMDTRLRASGITSQQAAVLALASAPPPPTQGEVARLLGVTHQNIRQIMGSLIRKGLLTVHSDAADRRAKRLVPTRHVARLFGRRNPGDFAAVAGWFAVLDDREVASVVDQRHGGSWCSVRDDPPRGVRPSRPGPATTRAYHLKSRGAKSWRLRRHVCHSWSVPCDST
jgi:DNA-binding MarR family transcriptional regulator